VAAESRDLAGGRAEHTGFGGLPTKHGVVNFVVFFVLIFGAFVLGVVPRI
jgi:hypothetical protein